MAFSPYSFIYLFILKNTHSVLVSVWPPKKLGQGAGNLSQLCGWECLTMTVQALCPALAENTL